MACVRYKFAAILLPSSLVAAPVPFAPEMPANFSPSMFNMFLTPRHTTNKGRGATIVIQQISRRVTKVCTNVVLACGVKHYRRTLPVEVRILHEKGCKIFLIRCLPRVEGLLVCRCRPQGLNRSDRCSCEHPSCSHVHRSVCAEQYPLLPEKVDCLRELRR